MAFYVPQLVPISTDPVIRVSAVGAPVVSRSALFQQVEPLPDRASHHRRTEEELEAVAEVPPNLTAATTVVEVEAPEAMAPH
jgi:hypothetical protein